MPFGELTSPGTKASDHDAALHEVFVLQDFRRVRNINITSVPKISLLPHHLLLELPVYLALMRLEDCHRDEQGQGSGEHNDLSVIKEAHVNIWVISSLSFLDSLITVVQAIRIVPVVANVRKDTAQRRSKHNIIPRIHTLVDSTQHEQNNESDASNRAEEDAKNSNDASVFIACSSMWEEDLEIECTPEEHVETDDT